jgi:hypothetical protein
MIRHMMWYISSSPSRSTRSMVTSSPGTAFGARRFLRSLRLS